MAGTPTAVARPAAGGIIRRGWRRLPPAARDPVNRLRHGIREVRTIPPAGLRQRVHGSADIASFLRVGRRCASDLERAAHARGATMEGRVLDFGVGCGRTLRWVQEDWPRAEFVGSDTDPEAIAWCSRRLGPARFMVNSRRPPLNVEDESFDLVYAVSVFTHLDEPDQDAWLAELRRATRREGLVLVTLHGPDALPRLPAPGAERLADHGFAFIRDGSAARWFPDWYQTSVHSPEYVRERFGRFFDVLDQHPQGLNDHQDLVVLRRS